MAVLVTGGAGYIGSVMVELLVRRGMETIVVDNLSRGHPEAVPPGVRLHVGDVTDPSFLAEVFRGHEIDAVLHFAAHSQVGESMRAPGEYFRNNVGGLVALATCMAAHGVTRFIFSSSAATYGDPVEVPIPETAPTSPTNPYGESKLVCERILHWFREAHGIRWAALRYFNAAGATAERGEDHTPETHLIPLALRVAAGTDPVLPVFGLDWGTRDGTCVRDYVHVEDLAEAHLLALDRLARVPQEVYNLGNGQGFTVLEVIRAVEEVCGSSLRWEAAPRRPGDPAALVASSEKAMRELDWRPRNHDLRVIVESAWRWMRANPRGYPRAR